MQDVRDTAHFLTLATWRKNGKTSSPSRTLERRRCFPATYVVLQRLQLLVKRVLFGADVGGRMLQLQTFVLAPQTLP